LAEGGSLLEDAESQPEADDFRICQVPVWASYVGGGNPTIPSILNCRITIGAHLMRRFGDPALPTRLVNALPASSGTPFGAARLEDETAVVAAGIAAGAVGIVFMLFIPFRGPVLPPAT